MGEVKPYYYFVTSPPTLASGVLVVGGWVMDNQETDEPSGVVRAYDPRTGELAWAWDMGREGDTSLPAQGETYTRGTPNVWSLTSADGSHAKMAIWLFFGPKSTCRARYWFKLGLECMSHLCGCV